MSSGGAEWLGEPQVSGLRAAMPGQVISREDPGYNEARTVINADDRPAPCGESEHSSCKGSVKEQSQIGDCVERYGRQHVTLDDSWQLPTSLIDLSDNATRSR